MKRKRAREWGVQIGSYSPGAGNAITDVQGVKVGHSTIIRGEGPLKPGHGPVRTGVTAILPHCADIWNERVSAASFVLNGNGSVTGLDWMAESGLLEGPILLTNTHSVGAVYDAAISWMLKQYSQLGITDDTYLPVVGECDDSALNDTRGKHVQEAHVFQALDGATAGPVLEGAVGAGTGMSCYEFKGGIGTSSRLLPPDEGGFTVGALVNCNHGRRNQLLIDGVSVGRHLPVEAVAGHREGSICIVVATDAPLSPLLLRRVAKRAALGLARAGGNANNGSGDFVIAFSTTRKYDRRDVSVELNLPELNAKFVTPLFIAAAEAVEEAVINALFMAQTTVGRDENVRHELPVEAVLQILKQHGRL
ncbi:MAG TPA: P1 family peptidase [Candidatus Melainabacteria bacterium]|nr:P1 family peptidase [Candidatus Melainabacteria bacterium]